MIQESLRIDALMEKLDADCLIPIFQYLSFFERVHLEEVCRRWYFVLQMSAVYSDTRELNVADFLSTSSSNYYQQDSLSLAPTVVGVVRRCGRYLRKITFGHRWLKISQPIADTIASYCCRLRELDLGCTILNADISELLEQTAERLLVFSLEETSWINDEDRDKVPNYFHKMKNLRKLNVRSAMFRLDDICELPQCLNSIEISGSRAFSSESFNKFLATHANLQELSACPLPVSDSLTIPYIGNLPALTVLQLGIIKKNANDFPMQSLAFCASLQELYIKECDALTGHSLRLLLEGLANLRSLTLIDCAKVLDYSCLSLCCFLEVLHVEHTWQISDDDLIPVAIHGKLTSLNLSRCSNITDSSILEVLRHCKLSVITLVDLEDVGDETLYEIASSEHVIKSISVQRCLNITSKGVSSLRYLQYIEKLEELDVSHNKKIDDFAIMSIHGALKTRRAKMQRRRKANDEKDATVDDVKRPTIYVFQTSVSSRIEEKVSDLITILN